MSGLYLINMPDGSKWSIPLSVIIGHRVRCYVDNYGKEYKEAYNDTLELFEDPFEVNDWAVNSMNWQDVKDKAVMIEPPKVPDYDDGWHNGNYKVLDNEKEE